VNRQAPVCLDHGLGGIYKDETRPRSAEHPTPSAAKLSKLECFDIVRTYGASHLRPPLVRLLGHMNVPLRVEYGTDSRYWGSHGVEGEKESSRKHSHLRAGGRTDPGPRPRTPSRTLMHGFSDPGTYDRAGRAMKP